MVTAAQQPAPDWDLTPYFSTLGGDDYRAFHSALEADLDALLACTESLPPIADAPAAWVDLLVALEAAGVRLGHLSSYLGCWTAADSADEFGQREEASLAVLSATREKVAVLVRAGFKAATEAAFEALVCDPRLCDVRYYLERLRRDAAHSMSAELEALNADLAVDGFQAWGRLYDRVSGNLTIELSLPGGPSQTLPASMVRSLLEDPDAEHRRAAFDASARAWESVSEVAAACLNSIAGTRLALYARRDVADFLDPALFDAGIERTTLDVMWHAVRSRQELARRFLRHKASLLGQSRLGFQDLMAPLPRQHDAHIPWQTAVEQLRAAFGASYPSLCEFAERAFRERWIDHQPRRGKRPGGFCSGSHLIGQSRVFMTYNGAMGDVQTLAHELGHAFHGSLMRDMRSWQRHYPMTLAETASTFAEKLVMDAALADPRTTAADRASLLDRRMQDAETFLLNIAMRFDFEHALYTRRAQGELSVSQLKSLMLDAQRANYGDALDPEALDPWFWASKLHFYITGTSFYNFPYTFGYLFSMGIFARAKAEGPSFLPRYEALLRATGSATAEQVAADALGVDLQRAEFWNASLDLVEADLDAFLTV